MITRDNEYRLNNLRKQLHRIKLAILEHRMSKNDAKDLIASLKERMKLVRV